jgi:transposase InsO family protein
MPWKESSAVEERLLFVARLIEGEAMTDLCREFSVSRKTGYKIFNRYKDEGLNALTDRCRRPVRYANQLPPQIEALIVRLKRDKPHWGARKIRELLIRRLPGDLRPPAKSTVHAVLDRHGLVARIGKRRTRAQGTPLSEATKPNDLWCADYKGEFKLGDGRYCYPLTVTDQASRFLLMCEAQESVRAEGAFSAFERLFQERGLRRVFSKSGNRFCVRKRALQNARLLGGKPLHTFPEGGPPSAPTMACLSLRRTACSISPSSRSGGSGSASTSSASSLEIRNKTAVTSACTAPSKPKRPGQQA